ncbi:arylsulfatase [Luteolibacter sp. Populi]|uniref:arylsulfatase n=1 Tax=Luteolibacter sp. Populi TaxID=3230487 RepID=UPI003465366A
MKLLLLAVAVFTSVAVRAAEKPNILLIVGDDIGYSDLGCFGSEIRTPNLDALAKRGLRATSFCAGPTCSPTRAMLMTGVDHHIAGLGNMHEHTGSRQKGQPGYEGHLNDRVTAISKVMLDGGYHTYMAGKWHLGEEPQSWPAAVGFERDFTLMQGGGSNWSDMGYPDPAHPRVTFSLNGKPLEKLPDNHFSTQAFSDFIITCLDEHKDDPKPFFTYLSYQACHSPFAVPDDWRDKYKGDYDQGYEVVRAARIARMKEMGIIAKDATSFPRLPNIPAWNTLSPGQQQLSARKMEIYAAMMENMDFHIGRVLDHLKKLGKLDNTLVLFMPDNGAEPIELAALVASVDPKMAEWLEKNWDTKPENWGRKGSLCDYGAAWAQVGSGPFRMFKHYVTEGGIRVPLIVAGPGVKSGGISDTQLHVTDLPATFIAMAGIEHPAKTNPKIAPPTGKSLVPLLSGAVAAVRTEKEWIGEELFGNRAIRQGDWKLINTIPGAGGSGEWELYNLRSDPGETINLFPKHPDKHAELLAHWAEYEKQNGVILTDDGPFRKKKDAVKIDND